MHFKHQSFFYLFSLFPIFCLSSDPIQPYNKARDQETIIKIITDFYDDIVSNSFYDPDRKSEQLKKTYATQIINHFDPNECAVYLHDNQTVGFIKFSLHKRWFSDCHSGYISMLGTQKEYQGQGFGRELLQHAIKNMKANHDVSHITLMTTSEEVGKKFYVPNGFKYNGVFKNMAPGSAIQYFWRMQIHPTTWQKMVALGTQYLLKK